MKSQGKTNRCERGRTMFRLLTISALAFLATALAPVTNAQAWTMKTLYNFCSEPDCTDGEVPLGRLVRDSAGNLYGTTYLGGTAGEGAVFELSRKQKAWSYHLLYSFCPVAGCADGALPWVGLIQDVKGNFYGTTLAGGGHRCGTAFRLSPNARHTKWKLKVLHAFNCAPDGDEPVTALTYQGAATGALYDGTSPLYGATRQGGRRDIGAVYEIALKDGQWTETVLYSFCCGNGKEPNGDVALDASGNLYGNTAFGGAGHSGTVYKLSPNAERTKWTQSVLYSFCVNRLRKCPDGYEPQGPLTMDSAGNLFGTTVDVFDGVVFRLKPDGDIWRQRVVYSFCSLQNCADGESPGGGVIIDASGNLFGTTEHGGAGFLTGGTVFELNGGTLTTLYSFCQIGSCADGGAPSAPLIMDEAGNLYGSTSDYGANGGGGTVFELSP